MPGRYARLSSAPPRGIDEVVVIEEALDRYRVEDSALSKLSESIRDTPQSIATLSKELLDDRGVTSLNDALRNAPGITLGAGEFSWQGNNPSIRGFSSRDDMYLDGLRDFGSYPRDPFNLESVEILLGPSSILFGRGSTGGAINQVSKVPVREALTSLNVNVGSDETVRATADLARPLALHGDTGAFRMNVLAHRGEIAGRTGACNERFGIAPTLGLGLGTDTQLNFGYMKQTSDDRPDYGLPWLGNRPAPVERDRFYGFASDYLETDADIASAQVLHRVGDSIRLDVQARYADYERENRITEPLINPAPPAGTPLDQIAVTRYVFAGTSDETLFTTQAVARIDLDVGRVQHALVTGVEWSRETSAPLFAFGIGVPGTSLLDPDSTQPLSATSLDPRIVAATDARTTALFALDTLKFSEQWQLTLGARWDAAAGAPLANAPEHSLNVWLNYRIASRFDTGLGARYVSEQFAQSAINGRMTPSYRTFDAMARYTLSDSLALKVNLTNLGDEFYFEQLHMWHIVPAAGPTVTFAVNAAY